MSRIGKLPIAVPGAVKVTLAPGKVKVEGPKGQLAILLAKASRRLGGSKRGMPHPPPDQAADPHLFQKRGNLTQGFGG